MIKPNPKASRPPPFDYNHRWRGCVMPSGLAAEYADLYARQPQPGAPPDAIPPDVLPGGFVYLVDLDGVFLVDADGALLVEG